MVARVGIDAPYVLTVGTIEPRKDLPTIVDAIERHPRANRIRRRARRRRPEWLGPGARPRPAVRARARRAAVVGRRRAPRGGRRRAASRRATRDSACRRWKRWRAAHRSRSPKAPRSKRSSATPRCCSQPATSKPAPTRCTACSPTTSCARELARLGPARRSRAHLGALGGSARRRVRAGGRRSEPSAATRRLRPVRVLLDVSAVPARPVGAGMYTVALASGLSAHDDVELHLLTRHDDGDRWSDLAPGATVHGIGPGPAAGAPRVGAGPRAGARRARATRRVARSALHDAAARPRCPCVVTSTTSPSSTIPSGTSARRSCSSGA